MFRRWKGTCTKNSNLTGFNDLVTENCIFCRHPSVATKIYIFQCLVVTELTAERWRETLQLLISRTEHSSSAGDLWNIQRTVVPHRTVWGFRNISTICQLKFELRVTPNLRIKKSSKREEVALCVMDTMRWRNTGDVEAKIYILQMSELNIGNRFMFRRLCPRGMSPVRSLGREAGLVIAGLGKIPTSAGILNPDI